MNKAPFYLFLLLSLFVNNSFATIDTNPVEKKVRWIWSQTLPFLKACLSSDECPMKPTERSWVQKIVSNQSSYSDQSIQFVSEADRPDLFTSSLGETHRLIVTGLTPTSPIYINSTRLLDPNSGVSIEAIFGLFGHELIHHLGFSDDSQRLPDQFGVLFANLVKAHLMPIDLTSANLQSFILNMPAPNQAQFIQDFPKGLQPRIVFITPGRFVAQDFGIISQNSSQICSSGDLWMSQASVSHVIEATLNGVVDLTIELRLSARCFLADKMSLQEEISYLTNHAKIDSKNGDFLSATFELSRNSLDQTSAQGLNVVSMRAPKDVAAGSELEIEATVQLLYDENIKGCAGQFTSPLWIGSKKELPLVVSTHDCQIVSGNGKEFQIKFKLKVPEKAPVGLQIKVNQVYLQTVNNMFIMGRPQQSPLIAVLGASTQTLAFKELQFVGGNKIPGKLKNAYYVPRGQNFELAFRFDGATQLIDGNCEFMLMLINRDIMFGSSPFVSDDVQKVQISVDPNGILNIVLSKNPLTMAPQEVITLAPTRVIALTSDWWYLNLDLSPFEYSISEAVPK